MKKILFLFLAAGLLYACKKDNIGSKPLLSFKSYSEDSITPTTTTFLVTLDVQDGDGDIEDSIGVAMFKNSEQATSTDTIWTYYKMPGIGQNKGNKVRADVILTFGEIDFAAAYNPVPGDSAHYIAFLRDNAGNISDSIVTPKFPFHRNR